MNDMNLNTRIQELAMMAEGGSVEDADPMAQLEQIAGSDGTDQLLSALQETSNFIDQGGAQQPNQDLEATISDLLLRLQQGDDEFSPEEQQVLDIIEKEMGGFDFLDDDDIEDPEDVEDDVDEEEERKLDISEEDIEVMKDAAKGLASLGINGDDRIAHVGTGEVVLPAEMMDDPEFAQAMMTRFEAMGIDPRERVVGSGIASLNDISGLEQFFFKKARKSLKKRFKKVGKSIKKRAKKVAKSVKKRVMKPLKKVAKKVVKVVAPVLSIIPNPLQPLAIGVTKLNAVRTAVKDGDILGGITAMSGLGGLGGAAGGGIASLGSKIGGALKNVGGGVLKGIGDLAGGVGKGIGSLASNIGGGFGDALGSLGEGVKGGIGALLGGDPYKVGGLTLDEGGLSIPGFKGGTFNVGLDGKVSLDQPQFTALEDKYKGKFDTFTGGLEDKAKATLANFTGGGVGKTLKSLTDYEIQGGDTLSGIAQTMGVSVDELMEANPEITDPNKIFAGANLKIPTYEVSYADAAGTLGFDPSLIKLGDQYEGVGGLFGQGDGQVVQQGNQVVQQDGQVVQAGAQPVMVQNPQTGQPQIIYQQAPQQSGGMSALGKGLAAGIPALLLAKFAYDEAKKDTGVQPDAMTSMSGMGRFNIEEEIARRTGKSAPNPVEYGLLPQGTLPQIAAAAPMPTASDNVVVDTQAYADGGYVEEDFIPMDGEIMGAGTERSDSIPAMLSDGEFVMNGQAVRGAGGYQMMNDGGIITLIPSDDEDRGQGTQMMYDLMDEFQNNAIPARG